MWLQSSGRWSIVRMEGLRVFNDLKRSRRDIQRKHFWRSGILVAFWDDSVLKVNSILFYGYTIQRTKMSTPYHMII